MKIVNKKLDLIEFKEYLDKKDFGSIPPDRLVIHHTWKPTKEDWQGEKSIARLKSYYEKNGWSAGPHLFIAEDGIWLFTDMFDVGIHAGIGNAMWKNRKTGKQWQGWGKDFVNHQLIDYSIGIEVVGNYDGKKWEGRTKQYALGAISLLMEKLKIPNSRIFFHRDFSPKTCPGKAITKDWLIKELKEPSEEQENKYLGNYQKIFKKVCDFIGEDFGDNPNDDETKKVIQELNKKAKEIDNLYNNLAEQIDIVKKLEKAIKEYKQKVITFVEKM